MNKQLYFFATKEDLTEISMNVESQIEIKYVKMGLFTSAKILEFDSLVNFNDLGLNRTGQATNSELTLLVLPRHRHVSVRHVPQIDGTTMYAIDGWQNPEGLALTPSGFYDARSLVAGKIVCANAAAAGLFRTFSKVVKANSIELGYARVCREAESFMDAGGRMITMGVDSPTEYDLRR